MSDHRLSLPEELLLLALNEEKGTFVASASIGLSYGLAGAAMVELAAAGLIELDDKHLTAKATGRTQDEVLDQVLEIIRSSERARSVRHWVGHIGRSSGKLKQPLLDRLVNRGILEREEGRILLFFPTRRYPEVNSGPERDVRTRIRSVVLGGARGDARTTSLISLVHATHLVGTIFEKGERREAKERIKEIAESQPLGNAVARAVAEATAAVVAAVVAASSAASSGG